MSGVSKTYVSVSLKCTYNYGERMIWVVRFKMSCIDTSFSWFVEVRHFNTFFAFCLNFSAEYQHSIGCYADVMAYMDSKCSGRQTCTILIATLEAVAQPCDKDFKSYLQATYSCVPGRISCTGNNQKELLRFPLRSQVEG